MAKFLPNDVAVDRLLLQLKMATYPWQEQLFKSRAGMVLLNCSRQAGKSTCVAFLALLEALTIQEHLVLMLSRSARQSKLLLSKVRDFMLRMPLKSVQRAQVSAQQIVFANLSKIVALPCKEETIRGYSSVGLLIIDEASTLVMGLPRPKGRVQGEKTPTAEEKQAAEIQARKRYLWETPAVWWKV